MTRPQAVTEANANPALAYAFQMPTSWQKLDPRTPDESIEPGLHLLGRYGPPDERCLVEVLTQTLEHEVSSADWLDTWLNANGFEVRESSRTWSLAGFDGRVLAAKRLASGERYLYRFTTFKNGNHVYVLSGFAHPDDMPAFDHDYAMVRDTFSLAAEDAWTAEPLRTTVLDHVVRASVAMPASWPEKRDQSAGPDQDSVSFRNQAPGETVAQIHVFVAPGSDWASHAELAEHVLGAAAQLFANPLPPVMLAPVAISLADAQQGNAFVPAGPVWVRIRLTVARLGTAWTSVLLVGFTTVPDTMLLDAMNNRAYEIALATLSAAP